MEMIGNLWLEAWQMYVLTFFSFNSELRELYYPSHNLAPFSLPLVSFTEASNVASHCLVE